MTITIHPFLVEIEITHPTELDGESTYTMWRLVFAEDKNGAWTKTRDYLVNSYITIPNTKYNISVKDTIV